MMLLSCKRCGVQVYGCLTVMLLMLSKQSLLALNHSTLISTVHHGVPTMTDRLSMGLAHSPEKPSTTALLAYEFHSVLCYCCAWFPLICDVLLCLKSPMWARCNRSPRYPFTSPPSTLSFNICYFFPFFTFSIYFLAFPSLPILPE